MADRFGEGGRRGAAWWKQLGGMLVGDDVGEGVS